MPTMPKKLAWSRRCNTFTKAQDLAEEIAQRSPDALAAAKQVLDAMEHAPNKSLR